MYIARHMFTPQRHYRTDPAGETVCTDATLLVSLNLGIAQACTVPSPRADAKKPQDRKPVCCMRIFRRSILEGETKTIIERKAATLVEQICNGWRSNVEHATTVSIENIRIRIRTDMLALICIRILLHRVN